MLYQRSKGRTSMRDASGSGLRILVCVLAFVAAAGLTAATDSAPGAAQEAARPDMVSKRVRLRGAEDSNITAGGEVNVRGTPSNVVPPASKAPGGRALCSVTFDNHTDLIAKTYIDGHFAGTIRPFADLTTSIVAGGVVLYARAEYDDGSADAWGPVRASCRTKYTWRLAD
jgi:hypothetical protein